MPKRYSEEESKNYCAQWRASGLGKLAFCKENKISGSTLYRWLKIYDGDWKGVEDKNLGLKFLAIEQEPKKEASQIEIILPNGVLLRTEVSSLAKLIGELTR
jgi:hypothetical protein